MASQPQIRAAERVTAKETASAPSKEQEKAPEANEPAAESDEEVSPQCGIYMHLHASTCGSAQTVCTIYVVVVVLFQS